MRTFKFIILNISVIFFAGCALSQNPFSGSQGSNLGKIAVVSIQLNEINVWNKALLSGSCKTKSEIGFDPNLLFEEPIVELLNQNGLSAHRSNNLRKHVKYNNHVFFQTIKVDFQRLIAEGYDSLLLMSPTAILGGVLADKIGAGVFSDTNPFNKVQATFGFNTVYIQFFDLKSESNPLHYTEHFSEYLPQNAVNYGQAKNCTISNLDEVSKYIFTSSANVVTGYIRSQLLE